MISKEYAGKPPQSSEYRESSRGVPRSPNPAHQAMSMADLRDAITALYLMWEPVRRVRDSDGPLADWANERAKAIGAEGLQMAQELEARQPANEVEEDERTWGIAMVLNFAYDPHGWELSVSRPREVT